MRLGDFEALTIDEFNAVCEAWADGENGRLRDGWERARIVATICVQPHLKTRVRASQVLPLPWDDERKAPDKVVVDHDEDRARFEALVKQFDAKK